MKKFAEVEEFLCQDPETWLTSRDESLHMICNATLTCTCKNININILTYHDKY